MSEDRWQSAGQARAHDGDISRQVRHPASSHPVHQARQLRTRRDLLEACFSLDSCEHGGASENRNFRNLYSINLWKAFTHAGFSYP